MTRYWTFHPIMDHRVAQKIEVFGSWKTGFFKKRDLIW